MAELIADYGAVLLVLPLMLAVIGVIGYVIARRTGRKVPAVAFLGRYGAYFFLLLLAEVLVMAFIPALHDLIRGTVAKLVGYGLFFHPSYYVSGTTIFVENPSLAFSVDVACLGTMLLWLYAALVLAEPAAGARRRIKGIMVGFAILIAFNFARIVLSIYMEWLTGLPIHDFFYLFNIVFVLLVWAWWMRTSKRRPVRRVRPAV